MIYIFHLLSLALSLHFNKDSYISSILKTKIPFLTLYIYFIIAFTVSNLESVILTPSSLFHLQFSYQPTLTSLHHATTLLVLRSQFIIGKNRRHFSDLPLASDTTTTNPQNFLHFLQSYYSLICKIFQ